MANQGAKKRVVQNAARLRNLQILIALANAVHIGVRFFLKASSLSWFNYFAFAATSGIYLFCYGFLHLAGEPTYDASGELTDGGSDLSLGGVTEYYHDAIYIAAIMQLVTLISDRFWWLLLSLPLMLFYLLWKYVLEPYIFTQTDEEREANEKYRQQKAAKEKRAARRRR